ncbi:zinc-binding dehydrogenase [Halosolutus halophilus]|uniref:zinc-binding dehydrogenase n=1 Tax=Halosolutus halophilus TaxID=1552990 RepID=UPI0022351DE6|nr:zinc-binding dehydrogenase [Halosolutus halophilus]
MVEVDIAYTGICGSDVHEYKIGPVPIRAEDQDHHIRESEWDEQLPKNMGHEIAGTVTTVGEGVEDVSVGDDVALNILLSCGECQYCREGKVQLCTAYDGAVVDSAGFAESIVVPAEAAVPVPDSVPLRHAALAEPMSVSVHAVRRSDLQMGDDVAVFGAGPIGLGIVDAAIAAGANRVLVSEPREARREIAADLGASMVVDPQEEEPIDRFTEISDGGVDVAFEVAGVSETLTQSMRSTKYDGTVVVVSVFEENASIHPNDIMQAERTVTGAFAYVDEFPMTLSMMADGRLSPEKLVTGEVPLEDVDDAFESLIDPESTDVKILVEP